MKKAIIGLALLFAISNGIQAQDSTNTMNNTPGTNSTNGSNRALDTTTSKSGFGQNTRPNTDSAYSGSGTGAAGVDTSGTGNNKMNKKNKKGQKQPKPLPGSNPQK